MISAFQITSFQKKLMRIFFTLLVFVFALGMRIEYISQREGMHMDEVMSVMISRYSPRWHAPWTSANGSEVKEQCFWNDASVTQALNDVKKLYVDNRDRPHTNFYYSLLRLSCIGISSFDLKQTIWRGGLLNLLLFSIGFFFMFQLLSLLFKNNYWIQPLGVLCAFCNVGAISNTLLLRPYQLQETCLIAFTYFIVKNLFKKLTNKDWMILSLVTGLVLLSGYFASIYVLMMYCIMAYVHREHGDIKEIVFAFLGSLLIAQLMYLNFFCGFTCGRAGEGYRSIFSKEVLYNLFNACKDVCCLLSVSLGRIIESTIMYSLMCTLAVAVGIVKKRDMFFDEVEANELRSIAIVFLISGVSLVWCVGNMFLANGKILRYIAPAFPLLMLVVPILLYLFLRTFKRYSVSIAGIGGVIISISIGWGIIGMINKKEVPYLYHSQASLKNVLNRYEKLPVYCVGDDICILSHVIQYCNDKQIYNQVSSKDEALRCNCHALLVSYEKYNDLNMIWHCKDEDIDGVYVYELKK